MKPLGISATSTPLEVVVNLFRLLLVFCLVPLIELAILLWLAETVSWQATLLLVILTGVIGASLARYQGWRTVRRIQEQIDRGEMPAGSLLDGLMILVAGALLITPGVLTDTAGFLLLVPFCRRKLRRWLARRFQAQFKASAFRSDYSDWDDSDASSGPVIDVRAAEPPSIGNDHRD